MVDAVRPRGFYASAEIAFAVPTSTSTLPVARGADQEVLGLGGTGRLGAVFGRVGLGLRLGASLFNLPGAKDGATNDGSLTTVAFLGELSLLLYGSESFVITLEPSGGVALVVADVPLVATDGSGIPPVRTVGSGTLTLALERSVFRGSLSATLIGAEALGGGYALYRPMATVELRLGLRIRRSQVRL